MELDTAGQQDMALALTARSLLVLSGLDPVPCGWRRAHLGWIFSTSVFPRGWFWHQLSPNGKQPSPTPPPKKLKIRDTPAGKEEKT